MSSRSISATFVAALLFVTSLLPLVAQANLVVNGGFETGDLTGWTVIPAATGSDYGVTSYAPHSGSYSLELGAVGSLDDTVLQSALPTVAGQSYLVDFWLYHPYANSQNDFTASWNGTSLLSLVNTPINSWTEYTYTTTATGPTSTIQFAGRDVPAYYYLDDVSVNPVATPEPSTFGLLGAGALALIGWAWRRRGS